MNGMKYYSRNGKRLNGWQDAVKRLNIAIMKRSYPHGRYQNTILVPSGVKNNESVNFHWLTSSERKDVPIIIICDCIDEKDKEMSILLYIKIGTITDFTNILSSENGETILLYNMTISLSQFGMFLGGMVSDSVFTSTSLITKDWYELGSMTTQVFSPSFVMDKLFKLCRPIT